VPAGTSAAPAAGAGASPARFRTARSMNARRRRLNGHGAECIRTRSIAGAVGPHSSNAAYRAFDERAPAHPEPAGSNSGRVYARRYRSARTNGRALTFFDFLEI